MKTGFVESIAWLYQYRPILFVLGCMMLIDLLVGLCAAGVEGKISSKVGIAGIMRKCIILFLIGMMTSLEVINPNMQLANMAALGFILMEMISIVESAKRAGVPMPAAISNALEQMKLKSGGDQTTATVSIPQNITVEAHVKSDPVVHIQDSTAMDAKELKKAVQDAVDQTRPTMPLPGKEEKP